ncbi:Gfo/Idh/MocA family oxidoreductase [Sporomusa termitida]|uniref:Thiaz-red: thiazolinyl imide reductase n=1 Tax=Sporomusa termitida TaxID=2377 RepID=A0A517DRB1_9FIRM|nr:Gfo/Idh/MocA family oxidoreductase [Sporomusa termitida]QDR79904.1 thiaz-red: thiazolinyl imide reductase [Sporomusa termitida]
MLKAVKPLRVVVCGTTFGRIYLHGIQQMQDEFELAGILARGSRQAQQCAEKYNVPLYTDVEQLPNDSIDVACVVIRSTVAGGQGTQLADNLLLKGIHVMQEYPVHHDDLVKCMRSARRSACHYRLNSFYPDLETVRSFIITARQALQQSEALYIDAACSIQVLFPLVDILGQSLGGFRPWSFRTEAKPLSESPFCSLSGKIRGIPINLRVQNQVDPSDPDNHTHLLHRIVIGTNNGRLMMTDSHGLVIWSPRMHVARGNERVPGLDGSDHLVDFPVTELVTPFKMQSFKTVYNNLWPESIQQSLRRFRATILSREDDQQLLQYHLTACQVWQDIGQQLGMAQLIKAQPPHPLSLAELQALAR